MKSGFATAFVAISLVGCATYQPVPPGYSGPAAYITDTVSPEDGTKAQVFALEEVDGNRVSNSFTASAAASYGKGFSLTPSIVSRQVPARPMKVKLRASHTTGAPIHALFSQASGTFFSVEGVVDFSPKPGGKYLVWGELKKEGSSIWIEDANTHQPVTDKIVKQ